MEQIYLAVYDIADARRLRKIAAILKDYGVRIQKSVFELRLSPASLHVLERRLLTVMDEQEDGIKLFPLCESCLGKKNGLGRTPGLENPPGWLIM